MANETDTPQLTSDDIAVLLEILRDAGRPLTTDELVAVLRASNTSA